jgi:hypothetical protein
MTGVYAEPRTVTEISDCYFYHTMDIPGYGHVEGEWDLREGIHDYLGRVNLRGKRVLELGTASGFVCFSMERQGAEVIAYDLSEDQAWDIVPYSRWQTEDFLSAWRQHIRKITNAFWLCHGAFQSSSKLVHGDVYSVPDEIGMVDVSVFGSILLHVRDPFLALQSALRLTRETVIITEPDLAGRRERLSRMLQLKGPRLRFMPDWKTGEPRETWWGLSPETIQAFIAVLGFEKAEVRYHFQKRSVPRGRVRQFTVTGHRTAG